MKSERLNRLSNYKQSAFVMRSVKMSVLTMHSDRFITSEGINKGIEK